MFVPSGISHQGSPAILLSRDQQDKHCKTCDYVAYFVGTTVDELLELNPSLSYDGSNPSACSLQQGYRYCVKLSTGTMSTTTSIVSHVPTTTGAATVTTTGMATPTPTQSGMVSNCNKFYDVVKDDGGYDIAAAYSIPLADFYSWNPAVKTDCSGLQPDFYVCVGLASKVENGSDVIRDPSLSTL